MVQGKEHNWLSTIFAGTRTSGKTCRSDANESTKTLKQAVANEIREIIQQNIPMVPTIASKAPYTAIEPPTPGTPSAGVTISLVNSALK